jgi:hypothetical protein
MKATWVQIVGGMIPTGESRSIRAETVANLEQTYATARHIANLQLKLADDN